MYKFLQQLYHPTDIDTLREIEKYSLNEVKEVDVDPDVADEEKSARKSSVLSVYTNPPIEFALKINQHFGKLIVGPLRKGISEIPGSLKRAGSLLFVPTGKTRPNMGFAFSQ
jgi:hypothetical protein